MIRVPYVISCIVLIIFFLLVKKSEKSQNILTWIALSILLFLSNNIVVAFICYQTGIPSSLVTLMIVNVIYSILFFCCIYRKKEYQKYYIRKIDICFSIIALFIVILIAYCFFDFPFNINYKVTDPAIHFQVSMESYSNHIALLQSKHMDVTFDSKTFMPGHYINCAILFEIFSCSTGIEQYVSIFIIFDLIMLYLSALLFYSLLSHCVKEKKNLLIACVFSIIYFLGYPLSSLIYGFEYLSLCLDFIITLCILLQLYRTSSINIVWFSIFSAWINFAIFFTYYLFVPVIYLVYFIFVYILFKKKEINKVELIGITLFSLVVPTICGLMYFVLYPIYYHLNVPASGISVPGPIYDNVGSNFILLIPWILYYFSQREKKTYLTILFFTSVIYTIIFDIGYLLNLISMYYLMKTYFLLWIVFLWTAFESMITMKEKSFKTFKIICTTSLLILVINIAFSHSSNLLKFYDLFNDNYQHVMNSYTIVYHEEYELIDFYKNLKLSYEDTYFHIESNRGRDQWFDALLNIPFLISYTSDVSAVDDWLSNTDDAYFVGFFYNNHEQNFMENTDSYRIIFKNDYGIILERVL